MNKIIGLFGTCGDSKWRDSFIETYNGERCIDFYNPQIENWKPEDAKIEADHLVTDDIILFPVTDETFGFGSLAETGFSILSAIRNKNKQFIIIYIAPKVNELLTLKEPLLAKESNRTRALVKAHLDKFENNPYVFVVDSLEQMKDISLELIPLASGAKTF